MSTIQSRIRELLRENKVTQKSLASVSGYTQTAINQMMLGHIKPNIRHIQALKELCPDMDADYILFGTKPKEPTPFETYNPDVESNPDNLSTRLYS